MSSDLCDSYRVALRLLEADPALGGILVVGGRPPGVGRPIPPGAQLSASRTPWGQQPGLLERGDRFYADLDLLPPAVQAQLAQRLDQGGCTLVAWTREATWAGLVDRLGLVITPDTTVRPLDADAQRVTPAEAVNELTGLSTAWGVRGNRSEWLSWRAALAAAACRPGRRTLTRADVALAASLVLAPRATQVPVEAQPQRQGGESSRQQEQAEAPPLAASAPPLPGPVVKPRPSLHGAPIRPVARPAKRAGLDLVSTLLAALPWQRLRGQAGPPAAIRPADLRFMLRRPRRGRLLIFLVDCSGSMGARRLGQAKGAVLGALQEAYRQRDQAALITAGMGQARLLLPPMRAVERARRDLLSLPAGGGTPLTSALVLAYGLAVKAARREARPSVLIAMTDGRANLPHTPGAELQSELKQAALAWRRVGSGALLLGAPGPAAAHLSRWLGISPLPFCREEFAPGRTTSL